MAESNCPSDELLLPMLGGGAVDPTVAEHLSSCGNCLRRIQRMRAEVNWLRESTHAMETAGPGDSFDTPREFE